MMFTLMANEYRRTGNKHDKFWNIDADKNNSNAVPHNLHNIILTINKLIKYGQNGK